VSTVSVILAGVFEMVLGAMPAREIVSGPAVVGSTVTDKLVPASFAREPISKRRALLFDLTVIFPGVTPCKLVGADRKLLRTRPVTGSGPRFVDVSL